MMPVGTSRARWLSTLVLGMLAVAGAGCSQALSQPMPDMKGRPLGVTVSKGQPSGWTDMPMGVHQLPDSSVYISGHQGAAGIGAAFGLIGLAAAHAAAQSTGERKTRDAQAVLRIDIVSAAAHVLTEELARQAEGRFATGAGADASLEIVPYLVLTFVGDDRARPWVVLKAALKDGRGDEKWKTRYMASLGEPRPLTGEDGWTAAGGAQFRAAVDRSLRAAIDVLLRDASGSLPRGNGRSAKVKGQWAWVKQTMEVAVEVLDENDETIVVNPKVTDGMVFAGISVLDKKAVVVTVDSGGMK